MRKERLKFQGNHGVGCCLMILFFPIGMIYYLLNMTKEVTDE